MEIWFSYGGDHGTIHATVVPSDDPVALGKSEQDRGMPVCTATVEFSAQGYRAMVGWVQLVNGVVDPFELFSDSTSPFCWYGMRPTLFDAPSRRTSSPADWTANSFRAIVAGERRVVPLAGFSWGFTQSSSGEVELKPVQESPLSAWAGHRPHLISSYPTWEF